MISAFRIEVERFNGTVFDLWNLKMEYLLDTDLWVVQLFRPKTF